MLLDAIRAEQTRLRMSHDDFAAYVGVSAVYWRKVRAGEIPMGSKFLDGIVFRFPDLGPQVNAYRTEQAELRGMAKTPA